MCHFLAPAGQPEMMPKNFMRWHLRIFVVRCSRMKFMLYFTFSASGQHQRQFNFVLVRVSRLAEAEALVQAHRRDILRRAGHHDLP